MLCTDFMFVCADVKSETADKVEVKTYIPVNLNGRSIQMLTQMNSFCSKKFWETERIKYANIGTLNDIAAVLIITI